MRRTIGVSVSDKDKELIRAWHWLKSYAKQKKLPVKEVLLRAINLYKSQITVLTIRKAIKEGGDEVSSERTKGTD
jgi:hypothetical protein